MSGRSNEGARLKPRAVFLDGGGTIVLPDRRLVAAAVASTGAEIDPAGVPRAHYAAVRALESGHGERSVGGYARALCAALGVSPARLPAAAGAVSELADRRRSGEVLWREPTPRALETIASLVRAGFAVLVVTNSDGHAAENLGHIGILAATGLHPEAVIDSELVGSAKPDTRIFEVALARAGVQATEAVHVGDMLSTDVAGAHAARITPIHFDPSRACRRPDHLHVRSLAGIWAHVERPG